jgi:hypothetical protein
MAGERIALELRLETRDGKRVTQPVDVEVRTAAPAAGTHRH